MEQQLRKSSIHNESTSGRLSNHSAGGIPLADEPLSGSDHIRPAPQAATATVMGEITALKNEVSGLKEQVQTLGTTVTGMKTSLEGKIDGVKEELTKLGTELKDEMRKNTDKLTSIDANIKELVQVMRERAN